MKLSKEQTLPLAAYRARPRHYSASATILLLFSYDEADSGSLTKLEKKRKEGTAADHKKKRYKKKEKNYRLSYVKGNKSESYLFYLEEG